LKSTEEVTKAPAYWLDEYMGRNIPVTQAMYVCDITMRRDVFLAASCAYLVEAELLGPLAEDEQHGIDHIGLATAVRSVIFVHCTLIHEAPYHGSVRRAHNNNYISIYVME
jgi:hypothetical protein